MWGRGGLDGGRRCQALGFQAFQAFLHRQAPCPGAPLRMDAASLSLRHRAGPSDPLCLRKALDG